jgi:hypothetical protein
MRIFLFAAIICACFNAFADEDVAKVRTSEWNTSNNPFRLDANFEANFEAMPMSGDTSKSGFGWPAYFWANDKGGIAQRWSSNDPQHFKYESPTLYSLKTMSAAKISELSPAEKFDIMNGRYDYPTVEKVWKQTSKGAKDWHGICHGAAPAGLHHKEPASKTVTNADGINITFHSSDIKALTAYYYAKISDSSSVQIGRRCFMGRFSPFRGKGCNDVNPAALHIILGNRLGLTNKGFIADIDRLKQVWNHVAVKYESKIVRTISDLDRSVEGTHKRIHVATKVSYTGGVDPSQFAVLGTSNEKWDVRSYEYILDLDVTGKIIGGGWITDERPDFIWVKDKAAFQDTYYGAVKSLLK